MTLNHYQEQAMTTCMESSNNVAYMFLNLVGEVGELTEKMADSIVDKQWKKTLQKLSKTLAPCGAIAKSIRKNPELIESSDTIWAFTRFNYISVEKELELQKECGDILWQLSGLCHVMGWNLEDIAQQNLDKLASRKERNQIDGEGDNR